MATATSKTVTRTEPKIIEVREEQITLVLNRDEANALAALLYRVGGHPDRSRRGLTDSVARALDGLYVGRSTFDVQGNLSFKDAKDGKLTTPFDSSLFDSTIASGKASYTKVPW